VRARERVMIDCESMFVFRGIDGSTSSSHSSTSASVSASTTSSSDASEVEVPSELSDQAREHMKVLFGNARISINTCVFDAG
jgi:hypothetical protein